MACFYTTNCDGQANSDLVPFSPLTKATYRCCPPIILQHGSRSMSRAFPPLSHAQLAALFTRLEHLESAGLPAFQAYAMLMKSEPGLKKPLALMQQQFKLGQPISEAGFRAGIFNDIQKSLIHAAEASGRLAEVYGQLARYYTSLSSRVRRIQSRLYFPAMTLIILLFVQPLPAIISSEISASDFLQLTLGRIFIIAVAVYLLVRLPDILRNLGVEAEWHSLLLKIPVVAKWIINRQLNEFFFILAIMLESGLSFSEALPEAVTSIRNIRLREQFVPAQAMLGSGASVADTLATVPSINITIRQIVNSSEQSGNLAGGILHFTQLEAESFRLQDDALAEWLPRLFYGMIAIWLAYSILGSHVSTVMPSKL